MPVFIGEIRLFGGNFAPSGWALCNGQLLTIASYGPLYGVIGTRYGGDGVTTFAVPDLRGRAPIARGSGTGLTPRTLGATGGTETHPLTTGEMAAHTHGVRVFKGNATSDDPAGRVTARDPSGTPHFGTMPDVDLAAGIIGSTGGGQAHNNMQAYLVTNYIIALAGTAPA